MSIQVAIQDLIKRRDIISETIRAKGIEIPEGTKLKDIPQYIADLQKPTRIETHPVWTEAYWEQSIEDAYVQLVSAKSQYTGHVDREGLKEIGWTDDDIDYFQENGVDWTVEEDDLYKVSEYEKELYRTNAIRTVDTKVDGVTIKATYTNTLLTNNDPFVVELRNNVRWMPKFQTTALPTSISFRNFSKLIGCPSFNFSATTNASYLFSRCVELRCVPPISFKTTANWNGSYMFYECSKLKTIPNTINWERCSTTAFAFADCMELLYLPEFTLQVATSAKDMFTNCQKVIGIAINTTTTLVETQDMFAGCRALITAPYFETSNCTNMANMFSNCPSLFNVPLYNTSKNIKFNTFFRNCSNLLSCPNFDFSGGVTTYNSMFMGCEKLEYIPTNMNFESCTDVASMCYRCIALKEFPYKLNINSYATSAADGIKTYTNCLYGCVSITKVSVGLYKASSISFVDFCPFIEEISIDNFDGGSNLLGANDLFRVTKIGGELKGMRTNFTIEKMRKLPKESLIYILERLEDMTDSGTTPKLTVGGEGLRNLTIEEKAIATNKGWILA